MRSGNPALTDKTFAAAGTATGENRMTLAGTVNKTAILLTLLILSAFMTWRTMLASGYIESTTPWLLAAAVGGFVVALVTIFKKRWASVTAPIYALLEGVVIGGISLFMELQFPGIALQAATLTVTTLAAMLMAYRSGLIRPTENFKLGVIAATGGIALLYVVDFVMMMFGVPIGFIHDNSWIGIGFSVLVVIIAALNLVLDFDFIETGVERGAPAYMEWYGAFGLLVTLVWLYLEILRLLAKARSR